MTDEVQSSEKVYPNVHGDKLMNHGPPVCVAHRIEDAVERLIVQQDLIVDGIALERLHQLAPALERLCINLALQVED